MQPIKPEPIDPSVIAEAEADLRAQLDFVLEQMRTLTHNHQRAVFLKQIYAGDPLTRERFTWLQANIDDYLGKMSELREDERLLRGWLERSRLFRQGTTEAGP